MDPLFVRLTGLTEAHIAVLQESGANTMEDLLFFEETDFAQMFPNANDRILRRKLESVILYKNSGFEWSEDLTPGEVIAKTTRALNYGSTTAQSSSTPSKGKDPMSVGAKFSVDVLKEFTGNPEDFEDWKTGTENTLGQTYLRKFLSEPPDPSNRNEIYRDQDLYYAFKQSVEKGTVSHIVKGLSDKSGRAAWLALDEWFRSDSVKDDLILKYQTKAENLELNDSTDVYDYINQWSDCQKKLLALDKEAAYSKRNLVSRVLKGIADTDYDVTKQLLLDE